MNLMENNSLFLKITYRQHLIISFCIRILLIIYSEYHDSVSRVPYTDVDYKVFTDAARHVWVGDSPYNRHTYRYSPIIAFLSIPNVVIQFNIGKIIFSIIDILVGILTYTIVKGNFQNYSDFCLKRININMEECHIAKYAMLFWLYNPFSIIISTRGNADTVASFCVLLSLYYLQKNNIFLAGLIHGLAIHIRLYPIIFSLALFMHLSNFSTDYFISLSVNQIESSRNICLKGSAKEIESKNVIVIESERKTIFKKKYLYYLVPNKSQLLLIAGTLITLSFFTFIFYAMYGYKFIYETYLYHLIRKDVRHNFSVFFYITYLTSDIKNIGIWQKVLTILPNIVLLLVVSIRYGLHKQSLYFSLFIQAFVMVTYNTVMTSQYFIWFISILPLLIWQLNISVYNWTKLLLIWGIAQLAWLLPAYFLEFRGQNTFLIIWLQSIAFFSANILILARFIKCFSICPDKKIIQKMLDKTK